MRIMGHSWNPKGKLNPAYLGGKVTDYSWMYEQTEVQELFRAG